MNTRDHNIARIHQDPCGRWHITRESSPVLDERGPGFPSRRAAIAYCREHLHTAEVGQYGHISHYIAPSGRVRKI